MHPACASPSLPEVQRFWPLPLSSCPPSDVGGRRRLGTRVGQGAVWMNNTSSCSASLLGPQSVLVIRHWTSVEKSSSHSRSVPRGSDYPKESRPHSGASGPSSPGPCPVPLQGRHWGHCQGQRLAAGDRLRKQGGGPDWSSFPVS